MQVSILFRSALLCASILTASDVLADLNPKQAVKLITRVAGSELPSNAVRVKRISSIDASSAEATAEIETPLRFEQTLNGQWAVREVRIAPERWESVGVFAAALGASITFSGCDNSELAGRDAGVTGPSAKRARCLLARILGVNLPSDAVRIKEVSPLTLPLSSSPSALVLATIQIDFRFATHGKDGWRVVGLRTGSKDWINLDTFVAALNEVKRRGALGELQLVAAALEKFRREHGFYVASDQQRVLIDHLAPRYLAQVIRIDPWHMPYHYQGERDHFTLRSGGPDGKQNTADDVVWASP